MEAVLSKAISQALAIIAKREAQELKSSHTAKAPRKAYQRTQYASLTPEEKEARKAYQRTRYANLTPEEKALFNAKQRARYHKRKRHVGHTTAHGTHFLRLNSGQGLKKRHNKVDNKCDKSIVRKIKKKEPK